MEETALTTMRLAGTVSLGEALRSLAANRPVFHSEADFQHALAWEVHRLDPAMRVRLETQPEPNVRLDLLLARPDLGLATVVELKYLVAGWAGEVAGESFALKNQGAQDISAYDVVKDISRLERFIRGRAGWNGYALTPSNDPSYWRSPNHSRPTNASAFRLYDDRVLAGALAWGPKTGAGTRRGREAAITLTGEYHLTWYDYSVVDGNRGGRFRLLVLPVGTSD